MSRDTEDSASWAITRPSDSAASVEEDNGQLKLLLYPETETVITEGTDHHDSQHESADNPGDFPVAAEIRLTGVDALKDVDQPSVGTRLRLAREQHGWTREEVATRLKLQAGLIRRIEDDNYSGIAHAVYLRGYLTSYSRLLGLPIQLAERVIEKSGQEMPLVSTGTISRSRYMLDRYSVSATYLILTGLVIGPAVWLATHGGLEQNLARTVLLDAPSTTISQPLTSVEPPISVDIASTEASMPVSPQPTVSEPSPIVASMAPFTSMPPAPAPIVEQAAPVAGTNSMTLKLKQASWVEVTSASGEKLEYGLLAAGTERSYSSNGAISVRIGNAEGAEILADGKPIDLAPFRRANVAHLKVFAEGVVASRADS